MPAKQSVARRYLQAAAQAVPLHATQDGAIHKQLAAVSRQTQSHALPIAAADAGHALLDNVQHATLMLPNFVLALRHILAALDVFAFEHPAVKNDATQLRERVRKTIMAPATSAGLRHRLVELDLPAPSPDLACAEDQVIKTDTN